jgi:AraC-like DNA-binding protein
VTPAYTDPEYVWSVVIDGDAAFILEDTKYYVKKGDMLLIPPYMTHIVNSGNNNGLCECVLHFDMFFDERRSADAPNESGMMFKEHLARENSELLFFSGPYVVSASPREWRRAREIFLEIKKEFDSRAEYYEIAVKAGILELLKIYLRLARRGGGAAEETLVREWKNLERSIQFIHNNYQRPLRLAEVSGAAGLSMNYFCSLFKNYTGVSPHHYLNIVRVRAALNLLSAGGLNVSQTAEKTGFSSVYLFSRVFKRITGSPPTKIMRLK